MPRKFGLHCSFAPRRLHSYEKPTIVKTQRDKNALVDTLTYYQMRTASLSGKPSTFGFWCASRKKCKLALAGGRNASGRRNFESWLKFVKAVEHEKKSASSPSR